MCMPEHFQGHGGIAYGFGAYDGNWSSPDGIVLYVNKAEHVFTVKDVPYIIEVVSVAWTGVLHFVKAQLHKIVQVFNIYLTQVFNHKKKTDTPLRVSALNNFKPKRLLVAFNQFWC